MAAQIPLKLVTGGTNLFQRFVAGDTIGSAYLDPAVVLLTGAQELVSKTFKTTKIHTTEYGAGTYGALLGSGGTKLCAYEETASADNFWYWTNGATLAGDGTITCEFFGAATNGTLNFVTKGTGEMQRNGIPLADHSSAETWTNKTLTTPTIGDFSNAQHTHGGASGGGALAASAITSGTFAPELLGQVADQDFSGNELAVDGERVVSLVGISECAEVTMTTAATTADTRYWIPMWTPRRSGATLREIIVRLVTGWAATRGMVCGIYANSGSGIAPAPTGAPISSTSNNFFDFDAGAAAVLTVDWAGTPLAIPNPGDLYWLMLWANHSTPTLQSWPATGVMPTRVLGHQQLTAGVFQTGATSPLWGYVETIAYSATIPGSAPALTVAANGFSWSTGPRFAIGTTWSA